MTASRCIGIGVIALSIILGSISPKFANTGGIIVFVAGIWLTVATWDG